MNAIVFNPNDPEALNPALAEAKAAGIKTVSVDAYVTDPEHLQPVQQPDQVRRARRQAGCSSSSAARATSGTRAASPATRADNDRDIGFKNALKDYPNIKVVPNADGVFTEWDPATATQLTNDFISSGQYDDDPGHLDVGHGQADRRRDQGAPTSRSCRSSAPTSAASSTQLLDPTGFPGLKGAAVTNTAAVGGAGVTLALKLLNGETVDDRSPTRRRPNTVLLDPVLADNLTDEGKAQLKAWQSVAGLDPLWPLSLSDRRLDDLRPRTCPRLQGPGRLAS